MQSFRILRHSIRQVIRNLGPALTVIAPVIAIEMVGVLFMISVFTTGSPLTEGLGNLVSILVVVPMTLAAVRWHLFVLTGERPGLFGPWHIDRLLPFIGRGLQMFAAAFVLFLPIFLVGAFVQPSVVMFPLFFVAALVVMALALRVSVMFPATALGRGFGPIAALRLTQGTTRTMIALSLMQIVVMAAIFAPVMMLAMHSVAGLVLATFVQIVGSVLITMVNLSIATTLYGHYIEGRELI